MLDEIVNALHACRSERDFWRVHIKAENGLTPLESAVFSMAVGVVCFEIALYIGGALAWTLNTLVSAIVGLAVGAIVVMVVARIRRRTREPAATH